MAPYHLGKLILPDGTFAFLPVEWESRHLLKSLLNSIIESFSSWILSIKQYGKFFMKFSSIQCLKNWFKFEIKTVECSSSYQFPEKWFNEHQQIVVSK